MGFDPACAFACASPSCNYLGLLDWSFFTVGSIIVVGNNIERTSSIYIRNGQRTQVRTGFRVV